MKTYSRLTLTCLLLILVVPQVDADKYLDEWKQLNAQALENYGAARYGVAAKLAEKQLAIAEKHLHEGRVAASLGNLALYYTKLGKYAEAEPLHKRSLAIKEKALGPDHPNIAYNLENLAEIYAKTDREAEAEKLEKRAAAIKAKPR